MTQIKLCAIAAMAKNRIIGKDNDLIWHISEDLQHFKRTTLGKPIIMGRKSFEALGKPLPGRDNIVISRTGIINPNTNSTKPDKLAERSSAPPLLHHAKSIEDGIEKGMEIAREKGLDEIFITGGGEIYKQTLPLLDRLYLTIVHKDYEGDTWFPEFDWNDWTITKEDKFNGDPSFTIYTLNTKQ